METSLRLLDESDSEVFYALVSTCVDQLKRYFPVTLVEVSSTENASIYLQTRFDLAGLQEAYHFGIFVENALIGYITVKNITRVIMRYELGYFLKKSFEGNGIVSKYVGEVVDYAFSQLNMNKVFLRIGLDNPGSKRIAEKNGFLLEGLLRQEFRIENGRYVDLEYYGRLRTERVIE